MDNPTIQRRRLGIALKRAREAAGRTQDEAAAVIDAAGSKISRLELGQSGLRLTDLNALLDFYMVADADAEPLRELARAGRQRGRWSGYRNAVPDWFRQYVDLESVATQIRWYQAEVVPGILQTEPYIQAMNATAYPGSTSDDEQRQAQVKLRLERQTILDRADTPELAFVLSESALRRMIGDTTTMRDQLTHLTRVADRPKVELQVLPFDAATYETASFSFTILGFDHDAGSDVIYLEDYTNAEYLDSPEAVRSYTRLWNRLQAAALGTVESRRLIERIADEIFHHQ